MPATGRQAVDRAGGVVLLSVGIVVLTLLNAGLMLRQRWLAMCGLAATLGYFAFLIQGMIEACL